MTLSTASLDGRPSSRIVSLRGVDERGLVFYSQRDSRKAQELAANPQCSLLFWWGTRQVRVEGIAHALSRAECANFLRSRPRANQIVESVGLQSARTTREALNERYDELVNRFEEMEIPTPEGFCGWRVEPVKWEFWQQESEKKLHDRIVFEKEGKDWAV
ncbi:hypothetical protein HDU93_008328, partial [Gonapodya sp. JEL0774]